MLTAVPLGMPESFAIIAAYFEDGRSLQHT